MNNATLDQRLGRDREALAAYQQIGLDRSSLRAREHAQILANLGVLYRRLGDPIKALATYDEALRLFGEDPLLDGELGVIKNRGIVLALDVGDLEGARATFSTAFDRASVAGNRREMLQALLYRAETERRAGARTPALADFTKSLATAGELEAPEETWKALYGLGRLAAAGGDTEAAIAHFDAALSVIEALREAIRVPLLRSDFFSDKREVYDQQMAMRLGGSPS